MDAQKNQVRCLKTKAASAYCGAGVSTFEKLRLTGKGPKYIKIGRAVVYRPEDLDKWLASKLRQSTSEVEG